LTLFVFVSLPAHALEITGFRIETKEDGEHVSLRLSGKADYKVFTVENPPPRVVVDFPTAQWRGKVALPSDYNGTLIHDIRFGFHDTQTSRLVFDLTNNIKPQNIQFIGSHETGSYWLEFDLPGEGHTKQHSRKSAPVVESPHADTKPVIVIDAGHGGQDPGTSGHAGTQEKGVTLHIALMLRDALLKTGHYRVALTRDDDRYLFLRDRVARARAAHGDLFISLHADSAPTRSARGLSVYTISETSSDKESAALAAKENKADVIGGMDLTDTSKDVADILIDLTQRETRAKSATFADIAIKSLGHEVHLLSNTHRFAGFAVLKAPDIPSVLVEVGFLTTPHEETELKSPVYQTKVVHGLVHAVDIYFKKKGKN
jgi:N-acetylmuramoyl-L-alanine amidase